MSSKGTKKKGAKGKVKKTVNLGMEANLDEVEETNFNDNPSTVVDDEFKVIQAVQVKQEMKEEDILEREKQIVRPAMQIQPQTEKLHEEQAQPQVQVQKVQETIPETQALHSQQQSLISVSISDHQPLESECAQQQQLVQVIDHKDQEHERILDPATTQSHEEEDKVSSVITSNKLKNTRGKNFKKAKTKMKAPPSFDGQLTGINTIKFEDDETEIKAEIIEYKQVVSEETKHEEEKGQIKEDVQSIQKQETLSLEIESLNTNLEAEVKQEINPAVHQPEQIMQHQSDAPRQEQFVPQESKQQPALKQSEQLGHLELNEQTPAISVVQKPKKKKGTKKTTKQAKKTNTVIEASQEFQEELIKQEQQSNLVNIQQVQPTPARQEEPKSTMEQAEQVKPSFQEPPAESVQANVFNEPVAEPAQCREGLVSQKQESEQKPVQSTMTKQEGQDASITKSESITQAVVQPEEQQLEISTNFSFQTSSNKKVTGKRVKKAKDSKKQQSKMKEEPAIIQPEKVFTELFQPVVESINRTQNMIHQVQFNQDESLASKAQGGVQMKQDAASPQKEERLYQKCQEVEITSKAEEASENYEKSQQNEVPVPQIDKQRQQHLDEPVQQLIHESTEQPQANPKTERKQEQLQITSMQDSKIISNSKPTKAKTGKKTNTKQKNSLKMKVEIETFEQSPFKAQVQPQKEVLQVQEESNDVTQEPVTQQLRATPVEQFRTEPVETQLMPQEQKEQDGLEYKEVEKPTKDEHQETTQTLEPMPKQKPQIPEETARVLSQPTIKEQQLALVTNLQFSIKKQTVKKTGKKGRAKKDKLVQSKPRQPSLPQMQLQQLEPAASPLINQPHPKEVFEEPMAQSDPKRSEDKPELIPTQVVASTSPAENEAVYLPIREENEPLVSQKQDPKEQEAFGVEHQKQIQPTEEEEVSFNYSAITMNVKQNTKNEGKKKPKKPKTAPKEQKIVKIDNQQEPQVNQLPAVGKIQPPVSSPVKAKYDQTNAPVLPKTKKEAENSLLSQLMSMIRFRGDEELRLLRERTLMLEEDIRSRVMRTKTKNPAQAREPAGGAYDGIIEENIALRIKSGGL